MKILVTGGNGQLGRALRRLAPKYPGDVFLFTDVDTLDITDPAAVEKGVADFRPDILVNCAAYTNVDKAEEDEAVARRLNAEAPEILAAAMQRHGGAMMQISTDYVFGGDKINVPLREEDATNPLGVYGRTKLEGEQRCRRVLDRLAIIRTAWLYSEDGRNFVRTMLDLTSRLPRVNVVFDQAGSPTYAADLAAAILTVVHHPELEKNWGTYHFSNEGICSWYDLARLVARKAGAGAEVLPCHSSEFPAKVTRPAYSALDKTKIKETFGIAVPYWTDSLDLCLKNLMHNG